MNLYNLLCGFIPIHFWHGIVHNYETNKPFVAGTRALIPVERVLENLDCLRSIMALNNFEKWLDDLLLLFLFFLLFFFFVTKDVTLHWRVAA
jgi:hypothetical protein